MGVFIDISGRQFGRLTVVGRHDSTAHGVRWRCRCDCGAEVTAFGSDLRRGFTRSCGCLQQQTTRRNNARRATHGAKRGGAETPTYKSWRSMRDRCLNANHSSFGRYGARGIRVCERWHAFENFLADMGERPAGKTLDRYPNGDGNYEPGNCRWATPSLQNHNRRMPGKSAYRGVSPSGKRWRAHVSTACGQICLGTFSDELSAARAYDRGALEHFGQLASTNFPREQYA